MRVVRLSKRRKVLTLGQGYLELSYINLYNLVDAPKLQNATFNTFIKRLITKSWIELVKGSDRRTKGLRLSDKAQSLLDELNRKTSNS
jgi:DNA-binding MarR family transcriptional regulator